MPEMKLPDVEGLDQKAPKGCVTKATMEGDSEKITIKIFNIKLKDLRKIKKIHKILKTI